MRKLVYKDPLVLISTTQDGYGDHTIAHQEFLFGLFHTGETINQVQYVEQNSMDAHVYLDPEDGFVAQNYLRIEGMYLIANPFGGRETDAWYKIQKVIVGQTKLLDNQVNNIHCMLIKTSPLDGYDPSKTVTTNGETMVDDGGMYWTILNQNFVDNTINWSQS